MSLRCDFIQLSRFLSSGILLLGLVVALAPAALAQEDDNPLSQYTRKKPAKAEKAAPAADRAPVVNRQSGKPAINAVTQAAVNGGIRVCANRLNQMTVYLTNNSKSGAFLFMPSDQPDSHLFSASLEVQAQGLPPMYASETVAPSQSGCDALYETVTYWDADCDEVAKKRFAKNKQTGVLHSGIAMLEGNSVEMRVFLMPAGKGCVSIKKEVRN